MLSLNQNLERTFKVIPQSFLRSREVLVLDGVAAIGNSINKNSIINLNPVGQKLKQFSFHSVDDVLHQKKEECIRNLSNLRMFVKNVDIIQIAYITKYMNHRQNLPSATPSKTKVSFVLFQFVCPTRLMVQLIYS